LTCGWPDQLLSELDRRLRELNVWILIDQLLMKKAEGLILLTDDPFFLIKGHMNDILGVLSIINRIIIYSRRLDCERERDLKEERS